MNNFESEKYYFIVFSELNSYESLDKIGEILSRELKFDIIEKSDGPDSRVWKLTIDDVIVELINNDPYGNFLRAADNKGKEKLKKIRSLLSLYFK